MQLAENINKKWAPVLDHPDLPEIKDAHRRAVTAMCLENVESQYAQDQQTGGLLSETVPVSVMGTTTASPTDGGAAAGTDAANFGFFAYNFFQLEIRLYLSPSLGMELNIDLFLTSRLRIV